MNSKADIIKVLLQKKLKFKIPKTYSFTIKDWYTNSKLIKEKIEINFKNKIIIVRSSALDEDGDLEYLLANICLFKILKLRK